jgi:hypothetical protein
MDPFTLSAVGAEALKLGIQFLYGQAGEVLERWRARRDGKAADPSVATVGSGVQVLKVEPRDLKVDFTALDKLEPEVRSLMATLAGYADGSEGVDVDDPGLVKAANALRCTLERILERDLSFKGEERAEIGVEMSIDEVAGYAAAVLTDGAPGRVRADVNVGRVEPGGSLIGVDARRQK